MDQILRYTVLDSSSNDSTSEAKLRCTVALLQVRLTDLAIFFLIKLFYENPHKSMFSQAYC